MTTLPAGCLPRLLTRQQAAEYCGVSVGIFAARCPITPVRLGESSRSERWDVRALDLWLDTLSVEMTQSPADHWLAKLDGMQIARKEGSDAA